MRLIGVRDLKRPEVRRQHAHYRERCFVEPDRPAHDIRIAAEPAQPQPVAEDQDVPAVRPVLLGQERAADLHPDAQRIEKIVVDAKTVDQLGLALLVQRAAPAAIQRHVFK